MNSPFFCIQKGFGKGIVLDLEGSYLELGEKKVLLIRLSQIEAISTFSRVIEMGFSFALDHVNVYSI